MIHSIHYRIRIADCYGHYFAVTVQVAEPNREGQIFRVPAWIPGSYLIREFARHILDFQAEADGRAVAWEKISKDSWRCAPTTQPLTIHYRVYALDWGVRGAYLDTTRAYWNGPSVFMYADGQTERSCSVEIIRPSEHFTTHWQVATSLPRLQAEAHSFGLYHAENYDDLIDHPVEIGELQRESFLSGGIPHDLVLAGQSGSQHRADLTRIASDLAKICQWHIDLWGGHAPMDYYLFQVLLTDEGYGGLEHRASTSLIINRSALPQRNQQSEQNVEHPRSEDYQKFLGLASHEYFHTWNVKRLKPAAFVPYNLSQENYTQQLWWFEGITSYYDDLALVRTGLISVEDYLSNLAKTITAVRRSAGRMVQSVAEASFDAWVKYYRQDENTPNAQVSYYTLGSLVGLVLDLALRQKTSFSLDDVVRALWKRYGGKEQPRTGLPENGIEEMLAELTGFSWQGFFQRYIYGKEELPLEECFQAFAIQLDWRVAENSRDQGGSKTTAPKASPVKPWLGARLQTNSLKLTHILRGGSAESAGLIAGDQLLAMNNQQLTNENWETQLSSYAVGEQVEIHFFRRQELRKVWMPLLPAPADTAWLTLAATTTPEAVIRRKAWLEGVGPA